MIDKGKVIATERIVEGLQSKLSAQSPILEGISSKLSLCMLRMTNKKVIENDPESEYLSGCLKSYLRLSSMVNLLPGVPSVFLYRTLIFLTVPMIVSLCSTAI